MKAGVRPVECEEQGVCVWQGRQETSKQIIECDNVLMVRKCMKEKKQGSPTAFMLF